VNFLVLLVAVIVTELLGSQAAIQRDHWFARWRGWLAESAIPAAPPPLLRALVLLVPVLILALLLHLCGGWLFGLSGVAVNLLVLLYAFGRGAADDGIDLYREVLARGDVQAAWHEAAELGARQADNWPELHDSAQATVAYLCFERYFPVMFWFVVLGAPGALFYRLVSLAVADERGEDRAVNRQLLWVLEWVPLRLLGPVLAIVGSFPATMRAWRESLFSVDRGTAPVLADLVRGALLAEPAPSPGESAREVDALRALFRRALIFTVGLIALFELL